MMSVQTGRELRPVRPAAAAALLFALCLLAAALLAAAATADPDAQPEVLIIESGSVGDLRDQAARVRREVDRLDRVAGIAVEKYNIARGELDAINVRLLEARRRLAGVQAQLDAAQAVLAQRMADMYKNEGVSLLDVLLNADDFTEVGRQIDYFKLINEADADAVTRIETLEREVAALNQTLEDDRAAALDKEMELREQRADIEDQLAQRQALLAEIDGRIKRILEREARLAAAAARRLANAAGVNLDTLTGKPAQLAVVRETMRWLGVPYVWGGASPSGFDCSGLVLFVYAKFGVQFPHGATMQARMGVPVPLDQLEPADLVFFGGPGFYHHVGIYVGDGLFIEAPHTGDVVKVSVLAGRGCALACRYPISLP
jgi:cell wall-associated NlpC family hydrolase